MLTVLLGEQLRAVDVLLEFSECKRIVGLGKHLVVHASVKEASLQDIAVPLHS